MKQYEDDLKASFQTATARGDYRYNAMLDDYSLTASKRQNVVDRSYRAKLASISTEGFSEQDKISHDLLLHVLDDRISDFELISLSVNQTSFLSAPSSSVTWGASGVAVRPKSHWTTEHAER
jgi:uncharacterized protein (DUF885 family)